MPERSGYLFICAETAQHLYVCALKQKVPDYSQYKRKKEKKKEKKKITHRETHMHSNLYKAAAAFGYKSKYLISNPQQRAQYLFSLYWRMENAPHIHTHEQKYNQAPSSNNQDSSSFPISSFMSM